jgi:hypothetical protein
MSQPLDLWVPAIGAAIVGTALYGYASWITRRFDKRVKDAPAEQTTYLPPVPVASVKAGRASVAAAAPQKQALKTRSASASSGTAPPSKP